MLKCIADPIANIVGDTMPLPKPFRGWSSKSNATKSTIMNALNRMFETHLHMPNPRHMARVMGVGKRAAVAEASYTRAEVAEWLWTIVVEYIDAKILSVLPRTHSLRAAKSGKTSCHVNAENGQGWPRSDAEWQRGASLVAFWLDGADHLIDDVSANVVVAYIRNAVLHATGTTIDEAMVQEHFSPVM